MLGVRVARTELEKFRQKPLAQALLGHLRRLLRRNLGQEEQHTSNDDENRQPADAGAGQREVLRPPNGNECQGKQRALSNIGGSDQ